MANEWGIVRVKRRCVPEWLWWLVCNPIPLWNQAFPSYRIYSGRLTRLFSERVGASHSTHEAEG